MKLYISLIFLFIFSCNLTFAQDESSIPVYDSYEDFAIEYLQIDNDTTYIINFWATWCRPCVAELPIFDSFHNNIEDKKLKVILVSLDQVDEKANPVAKFVERTNLQSDVVVLADANYNEWIDKIDANWTGSIPYTLILSKRSAGKLEKQYHSLKELEDDVERTLDMIVDEPVD